MDAEDIESRVGSLHVCIAGLLLVGNTRAIR